MGSLRRGYGCFACEMGGDFKPNMSFHHKKKQLEHRVLLAAFEINTGPGIHCISVSEN
ncbi:hypothetical protein Pan161_15130 [Gimesia algae]|uniref:Uncharacterized protein n=1 Tax=Gimesia algae TaxID=2527971 RepID=A0A517VA34_9PLAN|nr:hypothetical protein Pan161_15130 [Gimesia algae]